MSKYLIKYEVGPTAADCHEQIVDGESIPQACMRLWQWILDERPYLIHKIMVTSCERVIE